MHLSPYQLAAYFDGGGDGFKNEVNQTAPYGKGARAAHSATSWSPVDLESGWEEYRHH